YRPEGVRLRARDRLPPPARPRSPPRLLPNPSGPYRGTSLTNSYDNFRDPATPAKQLRSFAIATTFREVTLISDKHTKVIRFPGSATSQLAWNSYDASRSASERAIVATKFAQYLRNGVT